jgi:hypothetical protein
MTKGKQGFASFTDKALVSTIARMGGQAAHRKGTAHVWTSAEASEAGRKGVAAKAAKRAALKVAA